MPNKSWAVDIFGQLKEHGKKRFLENNSYYDYAYSMRRNLREGDVLVFYSDMKDR
jgi:hypothetical protein